jgi:hypothetical protein
MYCITRSIVRYWSIMLFFSLLSLFLPRALHAQETRRVNQDAKIFVDIPGHITDTLVVRGTADMQWSDTTNVGGYYHIQTEIVELDLRGTSPIGVVRLVNNGTALGEATGQLPGDVFPADYYIDLHFYLEFPDLLPGELFQNDTPVRLVGVIDDMPGYFDEMDSDSSGDGIPDDVDICNEGCSIPGSVSYWAFGSVPFAPKSADVWYPSLYRSEVGEPVNDTLTVHAVFSGCDDIDYVWFGYRILGSVDPFTDFYVDGDGSAPDPSQILPMQSGDGWSGYLDLTDFDPIGTWLEISACCYVDETATCCASTSVYVDPTPPIPEFVDWPPDSILVMRPDSLHEIVFETSDEGVTGTQLRAYPFPMDYERDLTPVDCNDLGDEDPDVNAQSCGPAAAACCLKYWADNGYPELKHPEGDTSRPEQTPEEMGTELQGHMGTDCWGGTTEGDIMGGIRRYLEGRGMTGWKIKAKRVKDFDQLSSLLREFETDREDVMLFLSDTVATDSGKVVIGHYVTLGSMATCPWFRHFEDGCVGGISHRIDFMDPAGGGSQDSLNFEIGANDSGKPTIKNYRLLDGVSQGDAVISGFISVSPPEGGGEKAMPDAPGAGTWIDVDAGIPNGTGIPDTLRWDTTGFPEGTYLLEVSYTDGHGNICPVYKLTGIPITPTDAGQENSPFRLPLPGIRGSYPNPFNPSVTIEYELPRRTRVNLTVYDAAGKRVCSLVENEMVEAGRHRIAWNGSNITGSRVASGVYFLRLHTPDGTSATKIILIR